MMCEVFGKHSQTCRYIYQQYYWLVKFKDFDEYADSEGFPPSNGRRVAPVILTKDGRVVYVNHLDTAVHLVKTLNEMSPK